MMRTLIRTSRWLVRGKSSNFSLAVMRPYVTFKVLKSSINLATLSHQFSTIESGNLQSENIDPLVFEDICSETLESLCEYFEELVEESSNLKGADITYSDGVLTVALGPTHGTYVINRQTPNKQIWLSSPISGPKRYDLVLKDGGYWVYKHDGMTLHELLQNEISKIVNIVVDFSKCSHSLN